MQTSAIVFLISLVSFSFAGSGGAVGQATTGKDPVVSLVAAVISTMFSGESSRPTTTTQPSPTPTEPLDFGPGTCFLASPLVSAANFSWQNELLQVVFPIDNAAMVDRTSIIAPSGTQCTGDSFPTNQTQLNITCTYTTKPSDRQDIHISLMLHCNKTIVEHATYTFAQQPFCTGLPALACSSDCVYNCSSGHCSAGNCSALDDCPAAAYNCSDGCLVAACTDSCNFGGCCGNGLLEAGEQCDDGNNLYGDGCSPDCTLDCGNGAVDPGEQCDDANSYDLDDCRNSCQLHVCGDNITGGDEECDSEPGCVDCVCTSRICIRNGYQADRCRGDFWQREVGRSVCTQLGEYYYRGECNSTEYWRYSSSDCSGAGEAVATDVCIYDPLLDIEPTVYTDDWTSSNRDEPLVHGYYFSSQACVHVCGDGIISDGEECDDGNDKRGDGCHSDCTCEDVESSVRLTFSRTSFSRVGQALRIFVNHQASIPVIMGAHANLPMTYNCEHAMLRERCKCWGTYEVREEDLGADLDLYLNISGANIAGGCDKQYVNRVDYTLKYVPECGNGYVDSNEFCDDANFNETDGCTSECFTAACGNGIKENFEDCDFGPENNDVLGPCNTACQFLDPGFGCTYTEAFYEGFGVCANLKWYHRLFKKRCIDEIDVAVCLHGCDYWAKLCNDTASSLSIPASNCDNVTAMCNLVCTDATNCWRATYTVTTGSVCDAARREFLAALLNFGLGADWEENSEPGASLPLALVNYLLLDPNLHCLTDIDWGRDVPLCTDLNHICYTTLANMYKELYMYNTGTIGPGACESNPQCVHFDLLAPEGNFTRNIVEQGCIPLHINNCQHDDDHDPHDTCTYSVRVQCRFDRPEIRLYEGLGCNRRNLLRTKGSELPGKIIYEYPKEQPYLKIAADNPCKMCRGMEQDILSLPLEEQFDVNIFGAINFIEL